MHGTASLMEIPSWLKRIEDRLRAEFVPIADELDAIDGLRATASSNRWGTLTGANGYAVFLSCMFRDRVPGEPDEVSLSVCFQHVDTEPTFDADVCWGGPSGYIEDEYTDHPIAYDQASIDELFFRLPGLLESLKKAAMRGIPNDQAEQ